jgi:hypothetical protein
MAGFPGAGLIEAIINANPVTAPRRIYLSAVLRSG